MVKLREPTKPLLSEGNVELLKDPVIGKIANKLCESVGITIYNIDFAHPEWFSEYSWTKNEEKEFQEWLSNYLRNSKQARERFLIFDDSADLMAERFTIIYGWHVKDKDE